MKKTDIEEAVKRAVEQAPTVDFEKLAAMPVNKMSSHDYITGQPEKQKSRHMKRFSAAFACCAVILVLFSGWFTQYGMPDSVIALDVNPSIEIVTNRHDQILSINALNEDAKDVLAGKKFDRDDLKGSVDTIIEALISQGFLNADKNVVLVSVENKDIKKADKLAAQVDEAVRDSASSQDVSPEIINQTFIKDKEDSAAAKRYHVSAGKVKLIKKIRSADPSLSMEAMTHMSVKDLLSLSPKKAGDRHDAVQPDNNSSSPSAIKKDKISSTRPDRSAADAEKSQKDKPVITKEHKDKPEKDPASPGKDKKDNQKDKSKT